MPAEAGSLSLVQSLIAEGLVDEYRLVICPVVLGGGRPLFNDGITPLRLRLANSRRLDRGALSLSYLADAAPTRER